MKNSAWIAICLGLAACSGSNPLGGGDGGGGGGDGGMMMMGGGDMALDPNAVMFTSTPFILNPGEEKFKCQDFANPFGGVDVDVQRFESNMTPGSHHMLLFYKDNATDVALNDCQPLQFGPLPYGAQSPHNDITFPDGIGSMVKGTQGFHMQMHYLNSTPNPITVMVQMIFHKAVPGSVTQHAGVFFLNNASGIHVPMMSSTTVTASYTFQIPVKILYATAHMHKYDNNLIATIGGQTIYSTTDWANSPFTKYSPEIDVPAGTTITWSCDVTNDTNTLLTFGESAVTNDMCIFDGQYYPVPAGADPTIASQQ
jgi:hypothetical protein